MGTSAWSTSSLSKANPSHLREGHLWTLSINKRCSCKSSPCEANLEPNTCRSIRACKQLFPFYFREAFSASFLNQLCRMLVAKVCKLEVSQRKVQAPSPPGALECVATLSQRCKLLDHDLLLE